MPQPRPTPRPVPLAAAALLAAASLAAAQSNEARLDPSGAWVQTHAPEPGTDEAVIADARRAIAEGRYAEARSVLDDWIDENDRTENPYLAEAFLLRGDALTAAGDEYNALYDYERVIKEYPGHEAYVTAVERELDIGVRYTGGLRRRFLGVRMLDATEIGEELLIRVQERLPGSRLGERAGIELADYYYRNRDLELAAEAYDLFMENYPSSQYYMKAMQRRVYATIGRYKGPRYDGSPLLDARILVQRFASLYPAQAQAAGLDQALLVRLDESAAQALMHTARWYLKRDDWPAGRYVLRRLVAEHPQTAAAQEALQILEDRGWAAPPPAPAADGSAPAPAEEAPAP